MKGNLSQVIANILHVLHFNRKLVCVNNTLGLALRCRPVCFRTS